MRGVPSLRRLMIILVVLSAPISVGTGAQEIAGVVYAPDVFHELSLLDEARPPIVLQNDVILTYRSNRYVRYVAAAFAHEDYQELHVFSARSDPDTDPAGELLFLVYPITPDMRELRYRLVVDGVWMADPNTDDTVYDNRGIPISRVTLMERPIREFTSPVVGPDGTVEFRFAYDFRVANDVETTDGRRISIGDLNRSVPMVVGSFNGWDPFMDRMQPLPENRDLYRLTTTLPPGTYYYYYLVGGERILDPTNPDTAYDGQTNAVISRLIVPRTSE